MRKSGTHVTSQEEKSLDDSTVTPQNVPSVSHYRWLIKWGISEQANYEHLQKCFKQRKGGGGAGFRIQEQMKRKKKKALLNFSSESLHLTFEHIMTHYRQKLKVSEVFCTVYVLLLKLAKINTKESKEKNGILMSLPLPCCGWLH